MQTPRYSIKHEEGVPWIAKNVSGAVAGGALGTSGMPNSDRLRFATVGATIADLDADLLKRYAASYLGEVGGSLADLTRQLDLFVSLDTQEPNDAAVLCFGRRPERFFPEASSMFSQGDKTSRSLQRKPVEGPLISQLETLMQFTVIHLRTIASFHDAALREDQSEIPADVIREVISNAIAHRDFFAPGRVHVHIDERHIDVTNPGRFPEGHSWQSLLDDPGLSLTPNPRVANHLQRLGGYEGLGRGFSILRKYRDSRGTDSITFTQMGDILRCRLLRPLLQRTASQEVTAELTDTKILRYLDSRNAALTQTPGVLGHSVFKQFVEPSLADEHGEPIDYQEFLRLISMPGEIILLTGSPGVGKSWLLQKCALDLTPASAREPVVLHLYVPLRELRPDLSLLVSIARSTGLESETIEYALKKHSLVLLFDGMDEMATGRERAGFLNKLVMLQRENGNVTAVISTRPLGDGLEGTEQFTKICLNEWSSAHALSFILENANEDVTEDARKLLTKDPDLFRSPVMLSLFLQVLAGHSRVPERLDQVYDLALDTLMVLHDQTKPGFVRESILPRHEMRTLLGVVALLALLRHGKRVPFSAFETIVERAIEVVMHGQGIHASTIVRELINRGLIVVAQDDIEFLHRALQEHLAARGAAFLSPEPEVFASMLIQLMRMQPDTRLIVKLVEAWTRSAEQGNRLMSVLRRAREGVDASTGLVLDEALELIATLVSRRTLQGRDGEQLFFPTA